MNTVFYPFIHSLSLSFSLSLSLPLSFGLSLAQYYFSLDFPPKNDAISPWLRTSIYSLLFHYVIIAALADLKIVPFLPSI